MKMLFWLVLNQFFAAGILFLRSNFAGLHLFKLDGFISVLDRIILIALSALLLCISAIDMVVVSTHLNLPNEH